MTRQVTLVCQRPKCPKYHVARSVTADVVDFTDGHQYLEVPCNGCGAVYTKQVA
jgi:hypothetical protein